MPRSPKLGKLYSLFWSLYGRYAWDDHREPARVSEPPQRIVEILQNRCSKPYERILDAGCGTGNYAIALAKAEFQVIGVDFAAGMLEKARQKVTDELAKKISFQQADLNLPLAYPDDYFDHVISISVLQAVARPDSTLEELYRVLKPSGTFVLSLPRTNSQVLSQSLGELVAHRIRHLQRRTPGKVILVVLKGFADRFHPSPRWTKSQTRTMLNAMGFGTIYLEEGRQILAVAKK